MEDFSFTVSCGCLKKGKSWVIKNPIANVVIFEGMEEHVSRYDKFAKYLNSEGFSVYGLDVFGQGENVNEDKSNIGVWPVNGFEKQLTHFHDLIVSLKENGDIPTYIFAHSMGSFYGQAFLEKYPDEVSKIVLCGSGGKNPALGIGKLLASILTTKKSEQKKAKFLNNLMFGTFNKKISNPETPYDWLSWNKDNVQTYINDPLCGFGPRNRFCLEFIKGMCPLYKKENLKKLSLDTSIFLISGDGDPVTNYGKYTIELTNMYKSYGVKNVENKVYGHMRHEILNETDWEIVAKDIVSFYKNV